MAKRKRSTNLHTRAPLDVDEHVGVQIREFRLRANVSQEALAAAIGVTFQQVQKYEKARNRISASRLHRIASVLNVPVAAFFPGLRV